MGYMGEGGYYAYNDYEDNEKLFKSIRVVFRVVRGNSEDLQLT